MERREFVAATASVATVGTAGCLDFFDDGDAASNRIDSLEAKLGEKNQTIERLRDKNAEYEVQLTNQSDELDALAEELSTKRDTISELEAQLGTKQDRIETLETNLDTTQDEVEALESEKSTLEDKLETQQAELDRLESRIADLQPEHTFSDSEVSDAVDVAHDIRDAVVYVRSSSGSATGYQIDSGIYATVDHVFSDFSLTPTSPKLWTFDDEWVDAKTSDSSSTIDFCVLKSDHQASDEITVDGAANLKPGDPVVTVGHPFNVGNWIIAVGRFVREESDEYEDSRRLIADIPTQLGNSGSPVFSLDGDFVGMNIAAYQEEDVHERPDDPFFSYKGYDPNGRIVPADVLADGLSDWGY